MGHASQLWFAMPAVLVLAGLRRQSPIALLPVALGLAGVGVTMYDAGPLRPHLAAIFLAWWSWPPSCLCWWLRRTAPPITMIAGLSAPPSAR